MDDKQKKQRIQELTLKLKEAERITREAYEEQKAASDELALLVGPFVVGDITESKPNSSMYKGRHVVIKVELYDPLSYGHFEQRVWMRNIKKDGSVGTNVIDHTWTLDHEKVGHMELTDEQRRTR